jgi:hypothetical protein
MKPIPQLTSEQIKRFQSKIRMGSEDSCWIWTASTVNGGYGQFRINGIYYLANRVAYSIHQEDPGDKCVCHACDNPPCCNPHHLWLGTGRDNHRDKVDKGRSCYGVKNASAKLTERDVIEIRKSHDMNVNLANEYGVTPTCIGFIRKRKTWRHI